jgi:hypothetical protein
MKHLVNVVAVAAALFSCGWADAKTFDAEDDIGLVAEDASPAVAARNTQLLSAALEAQWSGGQFKFRGGKVGPVLHPITCAGKEFYFAGTIQSAARYGGALQGAGGRVPLLPSGHYHAGGSLGGMVTRFTRIDGEKGGAILRIRGAGFTVSGIEFRGRPFVFDPTGDGPEGEKSLPKGTHRTPSGIEIEGRGQPPVGHHAIRDCAIMECGAGVRCLAGYYEAAPSPQPSPGGSGSETFVPHENHADHGQLEGVVFTGCDSCFRTESGQATNWSLRNITVNMSGMRPTVVLDLRKCGGVWADGIGINHPTATLIQVGEGFTPWANWIVAANVKWDRIAFAKDAYYKIFRYDGPADATLADKPWQIRVTGHLGYDNQFAEHVPDVSKLIDVPKGLPLDGILLDVERLPRGKFDSVPSGPWVRPTGTGIK